MNRQDIFKIAVGVITIHLILMFIFEGFALAGQGLSDTIVLSKLDDVIVGTSVIDAQIEPVGLVPQGVTSQEECESYGGVWANSQCLDNIQKNTGVDFDFFDVLLGIVKVASIMANFIKFLGSVVFFSLILSFRIMPLIPYPAIRFLVTVGLWGFQGILLYYVWAFISNWRGQRLE